MEKTNPQIALVICTRNRASKLKPFLESITRLHCSTPWELIMVDNGSTDDSSKRLNEFAAGFPVKTTIVTELRLGHALARNCGWQASKAPIIVFTDDDCYPDPEFLNDMRRVFADEELGFVGGRILLYDPTDARITIAESQTGSFLQAGDFIRPGFVQGANMAFRRQALVDINGFDDHLGLGTPFVCEDVDATLRALAAGWKGKYDPRPVVYHHHRRKPGSDEEKLNRVYIAGAGAYYMKCLLFMPQRWRCLQHVWDGWRERSYRKSLIEIRSAVRYFFHQLRVKPNTSY